MRRTSTRLAIPPEITENWVTIAILLIFLLAFSIRMVPTRYGTLMDPDAFFMYRMARDVVEDGYYPTYDNLGWQPRGRYLKSEMPLLSMAVAYSYIFLKTVGSRMTLMTWTVIFPAIVASTSIFPVYFIGREIRDKTTGLIAALLIATIPEFLHRSIGGVTDKECLALPLIIGGLAVVIMLLKEEDLRKTILEGLVGGLLLGLVALTWGGFTYILLLFTAFYAFIIVLDLLKIIETRNSVILGLVITSVTFAIISMGIRNWRFTNPFTVIHTAATIGMILYLLLARIFVGWGVMARRTAIVVFLAATVATGLLPFYGPALGLRFYVAQKFIILLNPFRTMETGIHITIQEHLKATVVDWLTRYSFYPFLAVVGGYLAFRRRRLEDLLILLWAGSGFYATLSAVRNTMLLTPVICVIASDAAREFMDVLSRDRSLKDLLTRHPKRGARELANELKLAKLGPPLAAVALVLMILPSVQMGLQMVQARTPRLGQGWYDALSYIRRETPEDSVMMSWWDYGHWITSIGQRRCVTDGATTNLTYIENTAIAYLSPEDEAIEIFKKYDVEYVLVPERDFWLVSDFVKIVGNIAGYPEIYYDPSPESGSISWDDLTPLGKNTTIYRLLFSSPDPEKKNFELIHTSPSSQAPDDTPVRIYKVNYEDTMAPTRNRTAEWEPA